MSRAFAIDEQVVLAIINNSRLISDVRVSLEPGDSIFQMEVHTGQEDTGNFSVIPEVVVEQRHVDAANRLKEITARPITEREMRDALA